MTDANENVGLASNANEALAREHTFPTCDCGQTHESVCGWCHQPIGKGQFNKHRKTECPERIDDLRRRAAALGYEVRPIERCQYCSHQKDEHGTPTAPHAFEEAAEAVDREVAGKSSSLGEALGSAAVAPRCLLRDTPEGEAALHAAVAEAMYEALGKGYVTRDTWMGEDGNLRHVAAVWRGVLAALREGP